MCGKQEIHGVKPGCFRFTTTVQTLYPQLFSERRLMYQDRAESHSFTPKSLWSSLKNEQNTNTWTLWALYPHKNKEKKVIMHVYIHTMLMTILLVWGSLAQVRCYFPKTTILTPPLFFSISLLQIIPSVINAPQLLSSCFFPMYAHAFLYVCTYLCTHLFANISKSCHTTINIS